jgi:hypothetical protein
MFRIRCPEDTQFKVQMGICTHASDFDDGGDTHANLVEVDTANGVPGNWYRKVNNGGLIADIDTTIAHDKGHFHTVEFVWDVAGTTIQYYIDGVSAGAGSAQNEDMYILVKVHALFAAAKQLYIDAIAYTGPRITT